MSKHFGRTLDADPNLVEVRRLVEIAAAARSVMEQFLITEAEVNATVGEAEVIRLLGDDADQLTGLRDFAIGFISHHDGVAGAQGLAPAPRPLRGALPGAQALTDDEISAATVVLLLLIGDPPSDEPFPEPTIALVDLDEPVDFLPPPPPSALDKFFEALERVFQTVGLTQFTRNR